MRLDGYVIVSAATDFSRQGFEFAAVVSPTSEVTEVKTLKITQEKFQQPPDSHRSNLRSMFKRHFEKFVRVISLGAVSFQE